MCSVLLRPDDNPISVIKYIKSYVGLTFWVVSNWKYEIFEGT